MGNHTIRKITPAGVVSTFAGTAGVTGAADGTGAAASFNFPAAITSDADKNIYVADAGNNIIRKITPAGVVSTFAGTAGVTGSADGAGAAASFNNPYGISINNKTNDIYVTDSINNNIRKITPAGVVSTLAGTAGVAGSADGAGAAASFNAPLGITVDANENVYIADAGNNIIRKITPAGVVSTFAGTAGVTGSADGAGAAASFNAPLGMAFDVNTGNIYVSDNTTNIIRKITADGEVTTLAGRPTAIGFTDDIGTAASFSSPFYIAVDKIGNIYIADSLNNTIRKIVWIPDLPNTPTIEKASSANGTAITSATNGTISEFSGNTGQSSGEEIEVEFRFSLSLQRIKLGMGGMTGAFGNGRDPPHTQTLAALEKALGAAKAMKQISSDITVWASGVYGQGQMKPMFTNPSAREKHYGIIMGSHYYHKPTKQLIGLAIDLGLGGSEVNTNHDMKNSYHSKQVTAYYGKGVGSDWNVSIHGSFMRIDSSHHRPYTATNGYKGIATSHGKAHVMSGMVEVSHKFKPSDNIHIKSSFGGIYGRTQQFAYKEHDAGANNQSYAASTMNEAGVKVGVKVSLFTKSTEHKTIGIYPQVNYTRYVKMGNVKQRITTINTGQTQVVQSGTAGKNLLNVGIGAGVTDRESNTKTQIGYTANFQKYRKSHEVMLKYSIEF